MLTTNNFRWEKKIIFVFKYVILDLHSFSTNKVFLINLGFIKDFAKFVS